MEKDVMEMRFWWTIITSREGKRTQQSIDSNNSMTHELIMQFLFMWVLLISFVDSLDSCVYTSNKSYSNSSQLITEIKKNYRWCCWIILSHSLITIGRIILFFSLFFKLFYFCCSLSLHSYIFLVFYFVCDSPLEC